MNLLNEQHLFFYGMILFVWFLKIILNGKTDFGNVCYRHSLRMLSYTQHHSNTIILNNSIHKYTSPKFSPRRRKTVMT